MSRYIVKFKKFDERTISSLVNKQVYFSTVHNFNDFGEFRFLNSSSPSSILDDDRNLVNEKLKDPFFIAGLIEGLYKDARICREYIDRLKANIKLVKIDDSDIATITEYIAFASVGIFCASKIDIFNNRTCQLMFAHYAAANKGIAMIYELSEHHHEVEYNSNLALSSFGMKGRHHNWIKEKFDNISDFVVKNEVWKYEDEIRLIKKPGLYYLSEAGLKLKKILYTPLFERQNIKTLNSINSSIYSSELDIKEIIPAYQCPFKVEVAGQYIDVQKFFETEQMH